MEWINLGMSGNVETLIANIGHLYLINITVYDDQTQQAISNSVVAVPIPDVTILNFNEN